MPEPAEPLAAPSPELEPAPGPVPQEALTSEDPELPDLLALLPPELREPTKFRRPLPGEPELVPAETALLGLLSGDPRRTDPARADLPRPTASGTDFRSPPAEPPGAGTDPWSASTSEAPRTGPPDGEPPLLDLEGEDEAPVDLPAKSREPPQAATRSGLAALLADGFALLDRAGSAPAAPSLPAVPAQEPREPGPRPAASGSAYPSFPERTTLMSTDISATHDIAGFIGACLVDGDSGLMLASEGGGAIDLEAAAALYTQVVRAKRQAIDALGLNDGIEDILITTGRHLHMIRPLEKAPSVFLYVALDRRTANLGLARMQVRKIESGLSL